MDDDAGTTTTGGVRFPRSRARPRCRPPRRRRYRTPERRISAALEDRRREPGPDRAPRRSASEMSPRIDDDECEEQARAGFIIFSDDETRLASRAISSAPAGSGTPFGFSRPPSRTARALTPPPRPLAPRSPRGSSSRAIRTPARSSRRAPPRAPPTPPRDRAVANASRKHPPPHARPARAPPRRRRAIVQAPEHPDARDVRPQHGRHGQPPVHRARRLLPENLRANHR